MTVVVVLLCAAGYAYMQGWFNRSRPDTEIESGKVSANQAKEPQNNIEDAAATIEQDAANRESSSDSELNTVRIE